MKEILGLRPRRTWVLNTLVTYGFMVKEVNTDYVCKTKVTKEQPLFLPQVCYFRLFALKVSNPMIG